MAGIDYGNGTTNINHVTGIRYGVIPANRVTWWYDEAEADYGEPTCPDCGNKVVDSVGDKDYFCLDCGLSLWSDVCFGDEPIRYSFNGETIIAEQTDYDIFVIKSEFYTRADYCSPCAPGACYLTDWTRKGEKCYCFGPDWFDDDNPCPYPVWRVSDNVRIYMPTLPQR